MDDIQYEIPQEGSDLPVLDRKLLNFIFSHVYGRDDEIPLEGFGEKELALLDTLHAMQQFNYRYRQSDIMQSVEKLDDIFNFFWGGSEGTSLWLAMILAIRELYGLSESKLIRAMRQVKVRK